MIKQKRESKSKRAREKEITHTEERKMQQANINPFKFLCERARC